MPLGAMPEIERLTLAVVEAVPEAHPEHATFEPFPVHAWLVRHPDGLVLVDTGIGFGHPLIDGWYRPRVTPLTDALGAIGVGVGDVAAVVLSHLHFDHCGQQPALACPVHVQAREHAAAQCAYRAAELRTGVPSTTNAPDQEAGRDSLARIRALAPVICHLSHDPEVVHLAGAPG